METIRVRGVGASNGIAMGKAVVLNRLSSPEISVTHDVSVENELARLNKAVQSALDELQQIHENAVREVGQESAQIFEAHQMVLQDPEFIGVIREKVTADTVNAEAALDEVTAGFVRLFEAMKNDYIRERASDIRDVSARLMRHLMQVSPPEFLVGEPVVVVANDLSPSETVQLDRQYVKAFVTAVGGRTSHSAIMARAMGIPAVVGTGAAVDSIADGSLIVVDGTKGIVIVEPDVAEQEAYRLQEAESVRDRERLEAEVDKASVTLDGHRVELGANIGAPRDLPAVGKSRADGIGLFRSEFLYMNRDSLPNEEEQFQAYRQVLEYMGNRPVIIRTFDIGGDKEVPYLNLPKEMNPFLGYRAIRICLDQPSLFEAQLRAVLRASHYGQAKIMFPMISMVSEVREAKRILEGVKRSLRSNNVPFDETIEIGVMVETPACALSANVIAGEVDFFSIGTNDLVQYTMACDRMNGRISYLYQPSHPAVLRLIQHVIDAAHSNGKWVGMCGELAGDKTAVPILLGLGLDEFSMNPASILAIRHLIRGISVSDAQRLAQEALHMEDQEQVRILVESFLKAHHRA